MSEPRPPESTLSNSPTPADEARTAEPGRAAASSRGSSAGRFALRRLHARGGLGEVHVAVDEELKRDVALKRMQERCAQDPGARRRFLHEAEITAKLEHPGIVPIYGLTHDANGEPCYAMRFIEGESLAEAIRRFHTAPQFTSLTFRQLLQRFISVCQTVGYAHSKQVIHRDLKPLNVMLGPFGETLVVDWGLAKQIGASDAATVSDEPEAATPQNRAQDTGPGTLPGETLGTPSYMAPEQAAGRWNVVGPCSDIYSLGATLHEMLTGERPVRGHDALEVLQRAQAGDFPKPRTVNPDIPKPLEAICLKAMARKPEDRYAAAADLAQDIEHWLADEPVLAYAEPWHERLRRWTRRHLAWLVSGLAATTAVLILAIVGLTVVAAAHQRELAARAGETQALEAAQQSAGEAERGFRHARQAVDDWFVEINDSRELRGTPQGRMLRRRLLEKARDYYEQFLREKADAPELREDVAGAYFRLAGLSHELDPGPRTVELYSKARQHLEALLHDHPAWLRVQRRLAAVQVNLGTVYRDMGRFADAETAYQQALRLLAALPEDATRDDRSSTQVNLGVLYMGANRYDDGLRCFLDAHSLLKGLVEAHPRQPEYRKQLGAVTFNLGRSYHLGRQMGKAGEFYEQALVLQQELVNDSPSDDELTRDLAKTYHYMAVWHKDHGRFDKALEQLNSADRLWDRLGRDHPEVVDYRVEQANNHRAVADVHGLQGHSDEALAALGRAQQVAEPIVRDYPAVTEYAQLLAHILDTIGVELLPRGRTNEAVAAFQRAADLLDTQLRKQPNNSSIAADLAGDYRNLGKALDDLGKKDESRANYQKARNLLEKLHTGQPADARYAEQLASLYAQLGVVLVQDQHIDEAQNVYEKAIALLEDLTRTRPDSATDVAALAQSYLNYGILERQRGRLDEAARLVRQALAAQERLVEQQPNQVDHAQNLAAMEFSMADILRDQKQPEAALIWYTRSLDRLAELSKRTAAALDIRRYQLFAHTGRGQALASLGRHADALKDWERCLSLAPDRYKPYFQRERGLALARSGQHPQAAIAAEEWAQSADMAADHCYDAACMLALCAAAVKDDPPLAEKYAGRAMDWLHRAVAKGFNDLDHLKSDEDLKSLRPREDFQELLQRLAKPPGAGA